MKWSEGGSGPNLENSQHKYYNFKEFGYLRWRDYSNGKTKTCYVHQLVFLAHNQDVDPAEVFSNGEKVIHHGGDPRFSDEEAKCPLFNWGENLELEKVEIHGNRHLNNIVEMEREF